jgi:hypothetical protein
MSIARGRSAFQKCVRNQADRETVSSRVEKTDELYKEASALCGAALRRLARGYEADADARLSACRGFWQVLPR